MVPVVGSVESGVVIGGESMGGAASVPSVGASVSGSSGSTVGGAIGATVSTVAAALPSETTIRDERPMISPRPSFSCPACSGIMSEEVGERQRG